METDLYTRTNDINTDEKISLAIRDANFHWKLFV